MIGGCLQKVLCSNEVDENRISKKGTENNESNQDFEKQLVLHTTVIFIEACHISYDRRIEFYFFQKKLNVVALYKLVDVRWILTIDILSNK